jgi:SAM-dependent methyltransferase
LEGSASNLPLALEGGILAHSVCPWWIGYFLASPLRRWFLDPVKLAHGHVHEGVTVVEPGPGMGFFTLPLARVAGPTGRVVAVDIQPKMLEGLRRRAERAGLANRIDARLTQRPSSMGLDDLLGRVDLVWAFAVVHELPDPKRFFDECSALLKPGGTALLAEPSGHVKPEEFDAELKIAAQAGFTIFERPSIRGSQAVWMRKS